MWFRFGARHKNADEVAVPWSLPIMLNHVKINEKRNEVIIRMINVPWQPEHHELIRELESFLV